MRERKLIFWSLILGYFIWDLIDDLFYLSPAWGIVAIVLGLLSASLISRYATHDWWPKRPAADDPRRRSGRVM